MFPGLRPLPPDLYPPLVLAALGGGAVLTGLVYAGRGLRALRGTATTEGRVLGARLEKRRAPRQLTDTVDNLMPVVEYEYEVDGDRYESDDLWPFPVLDPGVGRRAATAARRYDEGDVVTVHYDPANPSDAYLEVGGGAASVARWVVAGLVLVGTAVAWAYLVA